jgi:hypothetical protein
MARLPSPPPGAVALKTRSGAASAASTSGTQPIGVARLRAVLRRYISPLLLDSVLNRALENHAGDGLPPDELLRVVAADCMIGLRLFVKPAVLPELMLELAELLDGGE